MSLKVSDRRGPHFGSRLLVREQRFTSVKKHPSWWLENVCCSQRKHTLFYAAVWLSSRDITEEV